MCRLLAAGIGLRQAVPATTVAAHEPILGEAAASGTHSKRTGTGVPPPACTITPLLRPLRLEAERQVQAQPLLTPGLLSPLRVQHFHTTCGQPVCAECRLLHQARPLLPLLLPRCPGSRRALPAELARRAQLSWWRSLFAYSVRNTNVTGFSFASRLVG